MSIKSKLTCLMLRNPLQRIRILTTPWEDSHLAKNSGNSKQNALNFELATSRISGAGSRVGNESGRLNLSCSPGSPPSPAPPPIPRPEPGLYGFRSGPGPTGSMQMSYSVGQQLTSSNSAPMASSMEIAPADSSHLQCNTSNLYGNLPGSEASSHGPENV